MLIDEYEPLQIEALIKQASPLSTRTGLNKSGFSDYLWYTTDNQPEQTERKQVSEVLSNMEKTEYQIGAEIDKVEGLVNQILIVEGVAEAVQNGIQTYILAPNGKFYRKSKLFKTPMARYEAWLVSMMRAGVIVWRTTSWQHTASALVYLERSAMVESTALQRHLKIHDFQPNPYMKQVMSMPDIGTKLAEQLLELFKTPWDIYRQSPESLADLVPGIGLPKAKSILRGIGRKDI